jgi:hypothetical protein
MSLDATGMSVEATRQMMDSYRAELMCGGDYGQFFADDVRGKSIESGDEIVGRDAVADCIGSMHTMLFDAHHLADHDRIGRRVLVTAHAGWRRPR